MKLLFLDDDKNRHNKFARNNIGATILHAYTAREALNLMYEHSDIDFIFLDHDLDSRTNNILCEDEEDGRWLARAMMDALLYDSTPIGVHSLNQEGAAQMIEILNARSKRAAWVPFIWESNELLEILENL